MRVICFAVAISLLAGFAWARDGVIVSPKGQNYLYHVRGIEEVAVHCGGNKLGCIVRNIRNQRMMEIWASDSFAAAAYLCGQIEGLDQGREVNDLESELTQALSMFAEYFSGKPAPIPLCAIDRMHGGQDMWGRLVNVEEADVRGIGLPATSSALTQLEIYVSDTALNPVKAGIVIRNSQGEIVAEASGASEIYARLVPGRYYVRVGREGPYVVFVGQQGIIIDWILGLTE